MKNLIEKFAALPRAVRWSIAAIAFLGVYFALVEPSVVATAKYRNKADILRLSLVQASNRAAESSGVSSELKLGAVRFGETVFPTYELGSGALNKRISEVFAAHGVASWKSDERRATNLPRDAFAEALAVGERAKKILVDLDFQAHPTVISNVLADIERAPEVHSVSRVTLRKVESTETNALRANLSVETWIISRSTSR